MKVGFLLIHPISGVLGYSIRSYELTQHLSQLGIEVHVFSPIEADTKVSDALYYHHVPSLTSMLGVQDTAYRFVRKMAKTRSFLNAFLYRKRTLEWICKNLANKIIPLASEEKIDIMQGEASIPALTLLIVKRSIGVPVVTDIHDLWDEEEVLAGRICRDSFAFKLLRSLIREIVINSDLLLAGNEEIRRRIFEVYCVDPMNVAMCPDIGPIVGGTIRAEKRTETNDTQRVVYAGNFERYEYVDLFINSLPYLKRLVPRVKSLVIGTGPEERNLRKLATALGLRNIFLGPQSRNNTFKLCATCDVGVVPTKKSFATPNKPFDYMSVGLPIVSIKDMWWSQIVEEHQVGMTADFNPKSFAEAIAELLCSSDLDKYSRNAKNLILQKYNWHQITKTLSKIYDKLI